MNRVTILTLCRWTRSVLILFNTAKRHDDIVHEEIEGVLMLISNDGNMGMGTKARHRQLEASIP